MNAQEVIQELEERGVRVVAHIIHAGRHDYNVTIKGLQKLNGDIDVLKWERDERPGRFTNKKHGKKNALYQLRA